MPSLKSSFSFLFICFIFNIGKSQSSEKTQIDNIFFELVLKDMGKDKNIDNFCDNSILSEIHSLRIELKATTFKNKNKSIPDDFLSLDISPKFGLGWNTGLLGKAYLIKKNNFKTRKPKWDHCNSVYYDKFLSELTYEDFINQKWDFLSAMKNLESLVIDIGGSCESNILNFTIFSNNTINLKNLIHLEEIVLNGEHPYYESKEVASVIARNLNEIIVFGNNNKLKNIINITYEQFSSLSNSSNLKNLRTVIFSHPIDTLLEIKKINKIDNLYLEISKNIVKNDTLILDESFPVLDFVDTINSFLISSQIDFEKTTQFNLIFRNYTIINLLKLEGFNNPNYDFRYEPKKENFNKPQFILNIDISKYKHFLKFSGLQQPQSYTNNVGYAEYFIPTKLKLSLNTFQLGNYQNPNILFPKIKENSANMPTTYWFEINHIKTESEKNAELEQIKIQKKIKQKEEEFSGLRAFSPSDSPSTEKVKGSIKSTETVGVVTIGSQVWTSKNLNVSTYRNGDVIPEVRDAKAWDRLTTGAWCYYDNDPANGTKYGKLYNWYAVNDPRGLAPNGYHIPTDAEWHILLNYLGGHNVAGTKMKSSSGWNSFTTGGSKTCPNCEDWNDEYRRKVACHTCKDTRKVPSPIVTHSGNGTNSSGFSGLPGGCIGHSFYSYSLNYGKLGELGCWWRSATNIHDGFWYEFMHSNGGYIEQGSSRNAGFSVRCLRD